MDKSGCSSWWFWNWIFLRLNRSYVRRSRHILKIDDRAIWVGGAVEVELLQVLTPCQVPFVIRMLLVVEKQRLSIGLEFLPAGWKINDQVGGGQAVGDHRTRWEWTSRESLAHHWHWTRFPKSQIYLLQTVANCQPEAQKWWLKCTQVFCLSELLNNVEI